MKKILIEIALVIVAIAAIVFMFARMHNLRSENDRLKANQEVLLSENQVLMVESRKYRVSDSLNAAKVTELRLSVREFERLRAEDAALIKRLKINKKDLEAIVASQSETIVELTTQAEDTVIRDTASNRLDSLKVFKYRSKWTDVDGSLNTATDEVKMQIANRESLKIVESVEYKRFLGFLWRTKKVNKREVDVLSENPATTITNVAYTRVEH